MPLVELGHFDVSCVDEVYWHTGLPASQPFLSRLDLSWPIAELLVYDAELIEKFGTTGHLEPGLVANPIPDAENAGQQL